MAKKYFKFYVDYKDTFNLLNSRQQHKLLMAVIDYVDKGKLPLHLKEKTLTVFNAIKPIIDGDAEYERIRLERVKAGRISYQKRKYNKNNQNSSKILAKKSVITTH